jgi:ABC-2 type transport system ATP-binding protein
VVNAIGFFTASLPWPFGAAGKRRKFQQSMSMVAVAVQNLTKTFSVGKILQTLQKNPPKKGGTEVLKGISLEVFQGEALGLLGPNGAGKTTLLEILSTLLLPTGGEATICGYDVAREAGQVRKVVSYCPSASENFYPRLTGMRNMEFFALLNNLSPREARRKIQTVLDLVELEGGSDVPFQLYSEGMKHRLALARALLTDPELLLLDEPTRSLDPVLQGEIRKFLRERVVAKLGKTVLLVTHSLLEAEQVCDRLAILHRGQIVRIGTPEEIKKACGGEDLTAAFERAVGATSCQ